MGEIEYNASRVTFLATSPLRGSVPITGPSTGIEYTIVPNGTPVSNYDAEDLLKVTGPPCCGKTLPFNGQVKLFGSIAPTVEQLVSVPDYIVEAEPAMSSEPVVETKSKRSKKVEEPIEESVVEVEELSWLESVAEPQEEENLEE